MQSFKARPLSWRKERAPTLATGRPRKSCKQAEADVRRLWRQEHPDDGTEALVVHLSESEIRMLQRVQRWQDTARSPLDTYPRTLEDVLKFVIVSVLDSNTLKSLITPPTGGKSCE